MKIEHPNSQGWHAGEDIPVNARVKLVVDAAFPSGFKLMKAGVGERAIGHALRECKEDTADNRSLYMVGSTVRRVGFDAATTIIAGEAIAVGDELREGPNGTYLKFTRLLTGCTGEADDEKITKAAHGLQTGDLVNFVSGTGFTGLTAGRVYHVIRTGVNDFQLALTRADAIAGSPVAVNITLDGSSGVFEVVSPVRGVALTAASAADKQIMATLFPDA